MVKKELLTVPGFSWLGKNIGIKDESLDFGVIYSHQPANAAGVFTRSTLPGAPIVVGKEHIASGKLQAIAVNSKNSNVATGAKGVEDSRAICRWVGEELGIAESLVLPSSTGVIGRFLPLDKIRMGCAGLKAQLGDSLHHVESFARAIMTTDLVPKWCSTTFQGIRLVGMAKGSGMIEPNMATMLSYLVTDAEISSAALQSMLKKSVDQSFNRVSVDSDTSTSDTVILLANGRGGNVQLEGFQEALNEMCIHLTKQIARDGEGATKLIELEVNGAVSADHALSVARSIINSPLVKTAIYGADPNWGRFVMAIGKVFQYPQDLTQLRIYFGKDEPRLYIDSQSVNNHTVPLEQISQYLKNAEIDLQIVLGDGQFQERVWGCDFTEGYIKINAHYTT